MTSARKRGALRTLLARGAACGLRWGRGCPPLASQQSGRRADRRRRGSLPARSLIPPLLRSENAAVFAFALLLPRKGKSEPSRRSLGSFGRLWPLTGKTAKENELWNSGR